MKSDRLYLDHIRQAIDKIETYIASGREEFLRNPMMQDAVIRNFQIIGEATKKISEATKARRPEVPWRRIAGFRDILTHNYMGVDTAEVWNVIKNHLPQLRIAVEALLGESCEA